MDHESFKVMAVGSLFDVNTSNPELFYCSGLHVLNFEDGRLLQTTSSWLNERMHLLIST
jgi:hypothetical protein